MRDGDWVLTPEPIVIADTGRLLNGQHRLHALVQAKVSLRMLVITNVSEDVFTALDRGKSRSFCDNTGTAKKLAEVARLAAGVMTARAPTDGELTRISEMLSPGHDILSEACNRAVKVFSSAPVRLAAIVAIMSQPDAIDYVCSTYAGLVHSRLADVSPKAQAFAAAVFAGRVSTGASAKQFEMLSVAYGVFDRSRQNQVRVVKSDADLEALREALLELGIGHAMKGI
jgi:hypothetical protein